MIFGSYEVSHAGPRDGRFDSLRASEVAARLDALHLR